jgi:hypothetical protein
MEKQTITLKYQTDNLPIALAAEISTRCNWVTGITTGTKNGVRLLAGLKVTTAALGITQSATDNVGIGITSR